MRATLRKCEILRGYRSFNRILSDGATFKKGPLRCFYVFDDEETERVRIGFSVTRGLRNKPVRNRIKRLMRDSYRLNKSELLAALQSRSVETVVMFAGDIPASAGLIKRSDIEPHMRAIFQELGTR